MALLDLPHEILKLICAELTDYHDFVAEHDERDCEDEEEFEEDDEDFIVDIPAEALEIDGAQGSLLNLCLVSKQIRHIAEIPLYSFLDGKRHNVGFFFRTLMEQPRYAAFLRGLRIEPLGEGFSWKSLDKDLGLEWTSSALCSIIHRATVVSKSFPSRLTYLIKLEDGACQQEIMAQWLILNLPKLETLKITIPQEWSFAFLGYIAKSDSSLLQHLKTLHILGPPTWDIIRDSLVRLGPIACLLTSPRLKDFCLDYCVELQEDENIVCNAQRIAHYGCGTTTCQVGRLFSTCFQLRSYELEYNGGIALDLSYLSPCVDTLRSLELETSEFTPNLLTKYHHFKNIKITADSIVPRRPGLLPSRTPRRLMPPPPSTFLATILPLSIENICLGPAYPDAAKLWQNQLETLLSNEARKFRNLKVIEVAWQPRWTTPNSVFTGRY